MSRFLCLYSSESRRIQKDVISRSKMHESLVAFLNQQTSSHFRHAATGQQTTNLLSIALRRPSPGVINMFLLGSRSSSSNDFRGFCTTTRDPRQKLRSVHSRFQMDPVVHIFVFLLRTLLYPLIWLFPSLDYPIIQFGFGFVNLFRTRERVPDVEDPLLLISATEAARRIRNKELKSIDIVNSYIYRIKEVNPLINALVSDCFLEAIEEAENVDAYMEFLDDEEIRKLEIEKPLLGIPFTVKDSMDVKGREITVGIVLREGRISKDDAEVIKRTRDAGGILLGMTNVPESLMTIETLNAIFGVTCNPYDTRRSPGGSSGGEGALVSACGSLIGIGSDIGGSIRIPSFHNGIFGLKATQFFVPTKGQLPEGFNNEGFRKNLFSVGPIARYIEDIPLCLKAFNPEGAQALNLDKRIDLQKIKIFYLEEFPKESGVEHLSRVMREKLREVVEFFEKEHKLSAYGITFTELAEVSDMYITSVSSGRPITEFILKEKGDLDGSKLHKEIVKSVFGMSDHILNILMLLYKRSAVRRSNEAKQLVCDKRDRLRQKIIDLLKRENGVILMPSWASPPRFNGYAVWARINVSYTALWNTLSLPVLQCPTGLTADGLPTGIQIVGPPGSENTLLEVGKQVERFYGGWQAPWKK